MKKKYNISILFIIFICLLASPGKASASVNGWMLEAMKMLEEKNQLEPKSVIINHLINQQVHIPEIISVKSPIINTGASKTIADVTINLKNRATEIAKALPDPVISEAIVPEVLNEEFSQVISGYQIQQDYAISAFNENLKLSLVKDTLSSTTQVQIIKLNEKIDEPWRLKRVSPVYQFEIKNKAAYNSELPIEIDLSYEENDGVYKEVFFFDKGLQTWRPLPSTNNSVEKRIKSEIFLPFARLAVFSYPEVMTEGKASWYAYKGGDFAASPDFAKGSILRVINTDNEKSIDITVNDWGPERDLFPDRVIDLDKVSFSKISPLGAGIINVRVEPIQINSSNDLKLGLTDSGALIGPNVNSSSAIIWSEEDSSLIYEKDATSTLPIASLTKLIAIKTFFDTRPSLNTVVTYHKQDELNNHRYVDKPWRVARLGLEEGDQLTLEDLLYASLVGSSNNTVETIVRASGLTRDQFVEKMNANVIRWGAKSTHFIEPTGLSPENKSTVKDYAIITKELFKNPLIKKTSTMRKYSFKLVNKDKEFSVVNTNHLILKNTYRIVGSKTGYLDEAGYCLMTRVRTSDNKHIIIVLLGADSRKQTFDETEELIQYALIQKLKNN